ncbi:MAG: ABC transporter substrate-binding protein [Chloroflexota bacterium]|nr:ABC transporter substrate-binding protein [Chloroflexota bacterium]
MEESPYWILFTQARAARRRVLATGAAAAIAVPMAAAGCARSSGRRSSDPATAAPRRGGTLRLGTTLPLSSGLDPQIETGAGLEIFPRVYGYLLHVDPRNDSTIYDHAMAVEQPDETTFVLRLQPDIRFQDIAPVSGRAVTAQDVVASTSRYHDNPLVLNKTWHTQVLDRAEALDATTVRINTRQPNVYSLSEIGGISGGAIIPRELIDAAADLTTAGIGSGPFQIAKSGQGGAARIERYQGYFRQPLPYLDAMEWSFFDGDEARVAALQQRRVDIAANRDGDEARRLGSSEDQISVISEPSLAYLSLGLRVDRPPFNDPRVREAVDIALDRAAMIRDIAFGQGALLGPINPHIANGYWSLPAEEVLAAQGGTKPLGERRATARSMIAQAGAATARIMLQVAKVPQLLDVASVVRGQLQTLGLTVDLETLDLLQWFVHFRRGEFDMTLISHLPYESPDAPARMYHSAGIDGSRSPFGFADGAIDALVERSWREQDRSARRQTLLDAQRLMIAARPMVQLFTSTAYTSAWRYVRGLDPSLVGTLAQYNYGQWLDRA